MDVEDGLKDEGSSRRSFLRRMAAVGLVGVPVVSSFGLVSCEHFPPGGGGGGGNVIVR
jgi:hypothetical protein